MLSPGEGLGYTSAAMNEFTEQALLPEGLHDDLPPTAAHEAEIVEQLVAGFAANGYERVKPPLIEFEESLLAGPGAQVSRQMFRLMDPISQRMMAIRADMTTQVARIAASRLQDVARPLRLCYAGQVLRVRGTQLRPERQFAQAGAELIGADSLAGNAELLVMAVEALDRVGIGGAKLSVDLTVPGLVPDVCAALDLEEELAERVRGALDRKDAGGLGALETPERGLFSALLEAAGPAHDALRALARLDLPPVAASYIGGLEALAGLVALNAPETRLTIDPGESRGFAYETGVSFTLFARGVRGELGRGGGYQLVTGEAATGFTFYLDSVMRAVPGRVRPPRVFLPYGTPAAEGRRIRQEGWCTIQGLDAVAETRTEAGRLGCSHVLRDGKIFDLR